MNNISLRTIDGLEYTYSSYRWGDVYEGGKIVLQRMGIAPGLAFPGEPNANKRQISTIHSGGFACTIKFNRLVDRFPYCVLGEHPERSRQRYEPMPEQAFHGVSMERRHWGDRYVGKRADLIAAGLVQDGFFPGDPGMRKTRQVIYADGSFPLGAPTSNLDWSRRREAGKGN
ncbi:MAG: hypothetical protein IPJ38_15325 [Dechloromonas sp.]|uniref:Uncharacterized protein n=1 Tax=Candidatus Dechloromonas phosphorivorans TaxID=2899244 RepID=A0A935JYN9_9RHOO|nr:hypothetical protein [Candidatus Dechloromonas phosphorivorans]